MSYGYRNMGNFRMRILATNPGCEVEVVVLKVLVAEDNEDSRNLLVKQLRAYGHEVIAMANGAEALEQEACCHAELVSAY